MPFLVRNSLPDARNDHADLPLWWATLDRLIGQIYDCALDPSFVDPASHQKLAAMGSSASQDDLAFQAIDRSGRERPVRGALI